MKKHYMLESHSAVTEVSFNTVASADKRFYSSKDRTVVSKVNWGPIRESIALTESRE